MIHFGVVVLKLSRFEESLQPETVQNFYMDLTRLVIYCVGHDTQRKAFKQLAEEIYRYLIKYYKDAE